MKLNEMGSWANLVEDWTYDSEKGGTGQGIDETSLFVQRLIETSNSGVVSTLDLLMSTYDVRQQQPRTKN